MLIEWGDAKLAEYASTVLNGYKLDKNHVFTAAVWSDLKNLKPPNPDWRAPEPAPYNDVVRDCSIIVKIYSPFTIHIILHSTP